MLEMIYLSLDIFFQQHNPPALGQSAEGVPDPGHDGDPVAGGGQDHRHHRHPLHRDRDRAAAELHLRRADGEADLPPLPLRGRGRGRPQEEHLLLHE